MAVAELPSNISPIVIGLLIFGIGLSFGGPTGPSMNPARDLGPRLAFTLLPIPEKGSAEWGYAWIPSLGPIVGAILGALFFTTVYFTQSVVGLLLFSLVLLSLVVINSRLDKRLNEKKIEEIKVN